MRAKAVDLDWLPAREEWDFRSIVVKECRIACHWEYARQINKAELPHPRRQPASSTDEATTRGYCPANYRPAAKELFPQAWITLKQEQRAQIMDSFYAVPSLRVRQLGDFLKRIQGTNPELLNGILEHSYVIQPSFSMHGVEEVIKDFEAWARKEAKNYRQSPRAKAAEPPYDALKWLAVLRVEEARRKTGINFEKAREALIVYQRKHLQRDLNGVFPIYASHGAWSKARTDAQRLQSKVLSGSSHLLADLS